MSRNKPMTAAEALAKFEQDPKWVEARRLREEAAEKRAEASKLEQRSLTAELRTVGVNVTDVWDLVNTGEPYTAAIPILFKHLLRPYSAGVREGIARALAVREARYGWDTLVSEFKKLDDKTEHYVKSGLAVALSAAASPDVTEELLSLARDRRQGTSRVLLLLGLKRLKSATTIKAMDDLRNDPDLAKEIASWR